MSEQIGLRGIFRQLKKEGPQWASMVPELPRLVHRALESNPSDRLLAIEKAINRVERTQRWQTSVLAALVATLAVIAGTYLFLLVYYPL
jgi:ubiquinone biosynthesis protein